VKPIDRVIQEHAAALLAIEGVAGVYEGTLAGGGLCLNVAVVVRSPDVEARIPRQIDGYPVMIVETGAIGPLGS
jgi:hypothetical protein